MCVFPSVTASLDSGPSLLNHRPVLVGRVEARGWVHRLGGGLG